MLEHEAAALLPQMPENEFTALVDDIREHGLREPIVMHEGKILDGRHRWRACEELGIDPETKEWDGEGSPEAFVASMNLKRRHLTVGQRAMIAAKLATLSTGKHSNLRLVEGVPIGTPSPKPMSASEAGALFGVTRGQVQDAKTVLVNAGEVPTSTLAQQIKRGLTPKERAAQRTPEAKKHRGAGRDQTRAMKAQVYSQVRDGIDAFSTLPAPADVVRAVKGTAQHTQKVNADTIRRALSWLQEFSNEWHRQSGEIEAA